MQSVGVNFFIIVAAIVHGARECGAGGGDPLPASTCSAGVVKVFANGDVIGAVATGVVAVLAGVFSEFWLGVFYGDEFVVYGAVLRWYAVVYMLVFLGTPLRAWLRALEHTRPIFWATAGMLLFSLSSAYVLNVWCGLNGTMLGIFVSFVILQSILGLAVRRGSMARAGDAA